LRTVFARQNLIAHGVEARLYVMLEAHGPITPVKNSQARIAHIGPDASSGQRAKRGGISSQKRQVSSFHHEVLAEKILYRVGFCVGFLTEKGLRCN